MASHLVAPLDLTGKRFSRLTVIGDAPRRGHNLYYICRCDCGNEKTVVRSNLTSEKTRSCGCFRNEVTRKRARTHGCSRTIEHIVWLGMIARCTAKSNKGWKNYGGRGIKVCERWRHDFAAFLSDMGPRPSSEHSIHRSEYSLDRIDNDGNYEPSNCRWAIHREQMNNVRYNRIITVNGESKTVAEWTRKLGCSTSTIGQRLRHGWPEVKAVMEPLRRWE